MDVILKVTEGSKAGTKIAVKKEKFLIGRSPECHLCAGSTSISRKHCLIRRDGKKLFIEDLGSRNGTIVNGKKIKGEVELKSGDEIAIGNLHFLLTVTAGINNEKKSQVKSVAEAVERSVSNTGSSVLREDDITKWLLDSNEPAKEFTETQTIRMDDTKAGQLHKTAEDPETVKEAAGKSKTKLVDPDSKNTKAEPKSEPSPTSDSSVLEGDVDESDDDSKSKKKKKKEPGKLPPIEKKQSSKDSREAAVEALRAWNRRR
jgi:pSer/pThr/pTyr-binding forkhead associated (FHA) protein